MGTTLKMELFLTAMILVRLRRLILCWLINRGVGSYIDGKTGYGAAIFLGDKEIEKFSGRLDDTSTRQFGGELYSVTLVLKWCELNNIKKIRINYDYLGIEYFATGKWKPKNSLAQEYVEIVSSCDIDILWRKIDSHTGNKKNDLADKLAKEGVNK